MIKGIKVVTLSNDDMTKLYYDTYINFVGDDIDTCCRVSELRTYIYEKEFKLTSAELITIEKLAKELVASKKCDYIMDLVKGTIEKC